MDPILPEMKSLRDAASAWQARAVALQLYDRQIFADSRKMIAQTRRMITELEDRFRL